MRTASVSELVNSIKKNLEGSFRNVTIEGEVTNLSLSSSGHWYLSLSDGNALIGAAIFKGDAMRNPIIKQLSDGDKVMCTGSVSVYAKRGSFQLIIKRIVPVGKGDLKAKFEQLKKKLASEGLFDLSHKTSIPEMPRRIAVITALRGAALQDFLNIIKRRSHHYDILVVPALVQGDGAPSSIRRALEATIRFHIKNKEEGINQKLIDAIVLTRGGGSLEDLWAFNDEALAWDIYNCPIPIISAVGHQVDFSISDYVADMRCETPSAAAEVLTNKQKSLLEDLVTLRRHLVSAINSNYMKNREKLHQVSPSSFIQKLMRRLSSMKNRMERLNLYQRKLELLPFQDRAYEVDVLVERMKNALTGKYRQRSERIKNLYELLMAINPKKILSRGYSYTEVAGNVISSAESFNKLKDGTTVNLHYADGVVKAEKS